MRAGESHGILLVDKPVGLTSAGVVRQVKRRLGGAKVGHLGTLDPFATGLLPLCIGEGSKVVPFLNQERKAYTGRIRLGRETDTLDATGVTTGEAAIPAGFECELEEVTKGCTGRMEQTPPMFSAVKQDGVPLYRLARKGIDVARRSRQIEIFVLQLTASGKDTVDLSVECSKGTYVRVLAAEIARRLGTLGHLETLRRTGFGPFRIGAALSLESIDKIDRLPLVSLREALGELREVDVGSQVERELRAGRQGVLNALGAPHQPGEVLKILSGEELVAFVGECDGRWRIIRVLNLPS